MLLKDYTAEIKKRLTTEYPLNEANALVSIIFNQILHYKTHDVIIHANQPVGSDNKNTIDSIVNRLLCHEPIQYIFGKTEFFGLQFNVSPGVLIPRNETEELVQHIIAENPSFNGTILDIGTGSGCIAIALKKHLPQAKIMACDISTDALKTATQNAAFHKTDIHFFQYDILSNHVFNNTFNIIVSNPPYVTHAEKKYIEPNVLNHEPHTALFVPDSDPLMFYRAIADIASKALSDNGTLWLEINEAFGNETCSLLKKHEFDTKLLKDINKRDRIVRAQKKPV